MDTRRIVGFSDTGAFLGVTGSIIAVCGVAASVLAFRTKPTR